MVQDVDLMRELLFLLEKRQVSPRATVILSIDDSAQDLDRMPEDIEDSLNVLLDLAYIEGPGQAEAGIWLFRKLTRKGVEFVRATRSQRSWEKMKIHFAAQRLAQGA